ncbi:hypothetical protein ACGYLO_11870 [Sulfitobacter sp. 1A13353]|uniref:hypothetical protein n=1 Tax=Sulfitobacter sp. 1A13353 TaxID=3368568 RepID=UPI003745A1C2
MTTAQLPFRADIAGAMPPTMMKDVEGLLGTSSRLLGMYEAYKAFAVQSERFEPPLESDEITIAMLEDIHERAASVVEDAEIVADRGHTDGFVAMMRMTINDVVPSLEDLRAEAAGVIATGYNVEEEMPEFGQADTVIISSPFATADPILAFESDEMEIEDELSF